MRKLFLLWSSVLLLFSVSLSAQIKLGIKGGVNMANEISSFDNEGLTAAFQKDNLSGVMLGPSLEIMIPKVNIGIETAVLFSQKGGTFEYTINNVVDAYSLLLTGYRSSDYFEVPLNFKWKFGLGFLNAYLVGGPYFGYALGSKVVVEKAIDLANGSQTIDGLLKETELNPEETDLGMNIGVGIELFKTLQLGVNYSYGLKNTTKTKTMDAILNGTNYNYTPGDLDLSTENRVFSVLLTYYF